MNTFLIYTLFKLFVGIKMWLKIKKMNNHIKLKVERIRRVQANLRPASVKINYKCFQQLTKC